MNTPDGGVTDEPMPPDFARAYAEAYPDRVSDYVETQVWEAGKNSAARIAELEAENARLREALERFHAAHDDAQSGMSPIVHTAPSQSADLIAEAEERLRIAIDAQKRMDGGEYDNGIMAVIRCEDVQFYRAVATALRAAEAENARLSEENRTLRTNYRSGTSGDLNASDMRNIPDQEDDVSEAQEWEDFDRDC